MRTRFNNAERAAYTVGTAVEWRNGRHWHPGVIVGEITDDRHAPRWQGLPVRNTSERGGVPAGEHLILSPTYVRIPSDA